VRAEQARRGGDRFSALKSIGTIDLSGTQMTRCLVTILHDLLQFIGREADRVSFALVYT
jgi:hypothetical protein